MSSDCNLRNIPYLPVGEAHEFALADVDVQVPLVCPFFQCRDALFHVPDGRVEVLMGSGDGDVVSIDDFLDCRW